MADNKIINADLVGDLKRDGGAWDPDSGASVAASITAADAKTTPVDADTTALVDSEASGVLKKLSWANVKATLKSYFDTLYGAGDTIAPASNTADYVPQWNGADSKTLKDGLAVGTVANNLVQLDGTAKLPAVDGSQLTNLPAGFENPMTTAGDIIIGGTSGAAARLGIGTEGQVVKSVSGAPAWGAEQAVPAASSTTPQDHGTAAAGTGTAFSRDDHVHNTDAPDASDATPQDLGTAAAGASADYSRADHVHNTIDISDKVDADGSIALTADWDAGAAGSIQALLKVVDKTATGNVSAAECRGAIVTNNGATGTIALTLPAFVVGMSVTFYCKASEIIQITPATGERFSSQAANESLESADIDPLGSSITLVCMEAGVAEVVSSNGTWSLVV